MSFPNTDQLVFGKWHPNKDKRGRYMLRVITMLSNMPKEDRRHFLNVALPCFWCYKCGGHRGDVAIVEDRCSCS